MTNTLYRAGLAFAALMLAGAVLMLFAAAASPAPAPTLLLDMGASGWAPELLIGGMIVNQASLSAMFVAFRANYQEGFKSFQAQSKWARIAQRVPSNTRENLYAWLDQWPELREWLGDRVIKALRANGYRVVNRKFESTVEVPRDDIEDDQYGVFSPLFTAMGLAAAQHPDRLMFDLLARGFDDLCYDGQPFFDTDHPLQDANGQTAVVSNMQAGGGPAWFLFDTMKALKPLLFQVRREYDLKTMTAPGDEGVFMRDAYRYGVDARVEAGFGFWQQAFGSKGTLDQANYKAARAAMMSFKSNEGRPLGVMPNLLVVPPALESEGLELLNAERNAAGATNVYKGTAELLMVPWLAA
jgi:phage major head subunit gpT-like protein